MAPPLETVARNRRVREAVGLVLLFSALFALASLLSYDAGDATWFNVQPTDSEGRNWFGRVGATSAEAWLQLVGVTAFLLPLALAAYGWWWLRDDARGRSPWRWLGYLGLALSLSALCDLLFGTIGFGGETRFAAGGLFGRGLAAAASGLLNRSGALFVAATALAAFVVLTTRFSFVRSLELVARAISGAASWLREGCSRMIEEWRERPRVAVPPPRAAAPPEPPAVVARPKTIALEPPEEPPKPPPKPPATPAAKQQPLPMEPGHRGFSLPPIELLNEPEPQTIESEQDLLERARQITDKLREFAVHGSVVAVHPGPVVTTFEFKPEAGVKYSKITGMTEDLSLALKAESVRIDRMPGRATVGIEVPNRQQETIYPRHLYGSERFKNARSKLTLSLGKDISGEVFTADLDRMPHLLIAGATGSGKSVGLNGMITSILYKATPDEVRFIMIDTKMIELGIYAHIPHLLIPVVTDAKQASTALKWAVREMEQRYHKLAATGVRNIAQFNKLLQQEPDTAMEDPKSGEVVPLEPLPYVVIVIDELADLLMVASADVEESIMRLAQMARAVGLHLIIATQRPSVDVITGTIKANFPSRIAFRVSQRVDSRTIIDQQGAEHLLGRGDMLFLSSGASRLMRLHGGYITEPELNRIVSFLRKMAKPVYDESVLSEGEESADGFDAGERDEYYARAVRTVISEGKCSITLIQRRLQLGYARAARIVDMMEREGIVSAGEGSKPREILVGPEYLEALEPG